MKIRHFLLSFGVALLFAQVSVTIGQSPAHANSRIVVLENGNVLEGEIERQGDFYLIRRPLGELKVPVAKAMTVCATMEDAYKFLGGRADLRNADERLRLSRWCQTHGLLEQAIAEAKASLQMRPGHAESTQLLAMLERTKAPVTPPVEPKEAAPKVAETKQILEVSGDSLALFATKVQPILMNTCASCHASGKGGGFNLSRSSDAGVQRTTQLNLTAAIKQISFEQPLSSPLLHKACSTHGGAAQGALAIQQVPLATLQSWVELVAARNPQLKSHGTAAVAVTTLPAPAKIAPVANAPGSPLVANAPSSANAVAKVLAGEKLPPSSAAKTAEPPAARPVDIDPNPGTSVPTAPRTVTIQPSTTQTPGSGTSGTARALPGMENTTAPPACEFDPMIFNRMWHGALAPR